LWFTGIVITDPPQDNIVCVGDKVNITCGYELYGFSLPLIPVWKINGRTYFDTDITESSLYSSPEVTNLMDTVLIVNSATAPMNGTKFQCEFTVYPIVNSLVGTLTVMGEV